MYFTASSMTVTWNTTPKLINTMQEQTKLCNHYEDVRLDRSIGFLIQKHFFSFKNWKRLMLSFKNFEWRIESFSFNRFEFLSLQKMKRPLFHQPVNLGYRVCTWITFQLYLSHVQTIWSFFSIYTFSMSPHETRCILFFHLQIKTAIKVTP